MHIKLICKETLVETSYINLQEVFEPGFEFEFSDGSTLPFTDFQQYKDDFEMVELKMEMPKLLKNINTTPLIKLLEDINLEIAKEKHENEDNRAYIAETVETMLYGPSYSEWKRKALNGS